MGGLGRKQGTASRAFGSREGGEGPSGWASSVAIVSAGEMKISVKEAGEAEQYSHP